MHLKRQAREDEGPTRHKTQNNRPTDSPVFGGARADSSPDLRVDKVLLVEKHAAEKPVCHGRSESGEKNSQHDVSSHVWAPF